MKKLRRIVLLGAALLMVSGTGCSAQAQPNTIGLHYTGGPFQGRHFKRVITPGSGTQITGFGDTVSWLPVDQRNYIVSKKAEEGDRRGEDVITVPAKGGVNMDFEIATYFALNTSTKPTGKYPGGTLQEFWERIGKKYHADTGEGWDNMLNDNFRKLIESSMRANVFRFTVDELYANSEGEASGKADAIGAIQEAIASSLRDSVNTTLGGRFFCGPTFDRTRPDDCPPFQFNITSAVPSDKGVRDSFAAQRVAQNDVITAQQRANAKAAEADGIKRAQDALKGNLSPEYLELQRIEAQKACANSDKCSLTFIEGGGAVPTLPVR